MSEAVIQMYGTGDGGTDDAVANIDIPQDGTITGIDWAVESTLNADGEVTGVELSFIATNQMAVNDARGALSVVRAALGLLTSGAGVTSINKFVPMDIDVSGGERLYLHIVASSGVATAVSCLIHFRPRGGVVRRSRRRT